MEGVLDRFGRGAERRVEDEDEEKASSLEDDAEELDNRLKRGRGIAGVDNGKGVVEA
jgi:hypothetical protein